MLRIVATVAEWKALRAGHRAAGRSIGFVPTMGALHRGHATLFRSARAENAVVLASVFINPTQFDEPRDFERYPRDLEHDSALMEREGVDCAFVPDVTEMYPNGRHYAV